MVDRIISTEIPLETEVYVEKPLLQTEVVEVEKQIIQEVEREIPIEVVREVPAVVKQIEKEIQIVDRFEERLVEVVRDISTIKEVRVVEQVPVEQIRYIEVERIVNNFINVPQFVEIKEQVVVPLNKTIEKAVDVIQTIEKIVQIVNV